MSNSEGDILRNLVKRSDLQVQEFAEKLGMTRQNLNYLFKKRRIGEENKDKVASLLGRHVSELFDNPNDKSHLSKDGEKEALRDLVEAQKDIIKFLKEFQAAQLIRSEAFHSAVLARIAEIEVAVDPEKKKIGIDAVLAEAEQDVQEKIRELSDLLGLPVGRSDVHVSS